MVTIDSRELEARLAQQRQAVNAAEAGPAEAEPSYQRVKALFDRGVAARAELDRAQTELRAARAELGRASRAAEEAEAAMSYSVIKAPLNGRVSDRFADPGDTAIPGAPLLRLYGPEFLRLEANVRESLASELELGQEVTVRIDALDQTYPATLDEIVPSADPGTRTFLIKATLPAGPRLYPGMLGRLLIASGSRENLYIPERAVSRVGQLEFVWLATDPPRSAYPDSRLSVVERNEERVGHGLLIGPCCHAVKPWQFDPNEIIVSECLLRARRLTDIAVLAHINGIDDLVHCLPAIQIPVAIAIVADLVFDSRSGIESCAIVDCNDDIILRRIVMYISVNSVE